MLQPAASIDEAGGLEGVRRGTPGDALAGNIRVVARVRPSTSPPAFAVDGNTFVFAPPPTFSPSSTPSAPTFFSFDKVIAPTALQEDAYVDIAPTTTADLFAGYNTCILAYGQTGAGKTHTMTGSMDDVDNRGVVPRLCSQLFRGIAAGDRDVEYTLAVSYMELYNEEIHDLLEEKATPRRALFDRYGGSPVTPGKLLVHEDPVQGSYVKGLTEVYVSLPGELYLLMRQGNALRATGSTSMNQELLRLHAVFQVRLAQRWVHTGRVVTLRVFLVDLAGSEKVGRSLVAGTALREARNINKSLSALGNVIKALTEGSAHVPYRDLKLTRILKEALGGNSKTTLVVCVAGEEENLGETRSTLWFGQRAKKIQNHATVGVEEKEEWRERVAELEKEAGRREEYVKRLEAEVVRLGGTVESIRAGAVPLEAPASPLAFSLSALTSQLHAIEEQNLTLRESIATSLATSSVRQERIATLETILASQQRSVRVASQGFEERLQFLRERLSGVGVPRHTTPPSDSPPSTPHQPPRTPSTPGLRVGLHLRIVKPMRGGSVEEE